MKINKTTVSGFLIAVYIIWAGLGLPVGWAYDLFAGSGTSQGQWIDGTVPELSGSGSLGDLCGGEIPVTVSTDELTPCPLFRLRDPETRQISYRPHKRSSAKETLQFDEYREITTPVQEWVTILFDEKYNRYYLAELQDGSSVYVYFDDYLAMRRFLPGEIQLPVGYVRFASSQEEEMLEEMSQQYDVDTTYIVDMYRYGKSSYWLDFVVRIVLGIVSAIIVVWAAGLVRKLLRRMQETPPRPWDTQP